MHRWRYGPLLLGLGIIAGCTNAHPEVEQQPKLRLAGATLGLVCPSRRSWPISMMEKR